MTPHDPGGGFPVGPDDAAARAVPGCGVLGLVSRSPTRRMSLLAGAGGPHDRALAMMRRGGFELGKFVTICRLTPNALPAYFLLSLPAKKANAEAIMG